MTARADTDLLWLRSNASSASGVDCYAMSGAECERIIRDCRPRPVFASGVLDRLSSTLEQQFVQQLGGGR